jgi:hypothetical protein
MYTCSTSFKNYFNIINQKIIDDKIINLYQSIGHPMILKSVKTGRHLASMHAIFVGECETKQPIIIERPTDTLNQNFQIIFPLINDKDKTDFEVGKPIGFVITNLCHDVPYLKIDINCNDTPITETDPPNNINFINEIQPLQSFKILSDQTTGYKQLLLKQKKKIIDGTAVSVTLDEEVMAPISEKVGSYLYLTVTPIETSSESVKESFSETIWISSDHIINVETYDGFDYEHVRHVERGFSGSAINDSLRTASASHSGNSRYEEEVGGGGIDLSGLSDESGSRVLMSDWYDAPISRGMSESEFKIKSVRSEGSVGSSLFSSSAGKSKVAGIDHSNLVINQNSNHSTRAIYDYSLQSKTCKFGMSILENVSFELTEVITQIEALELIVEYIDFTHEKMVESIKLIRKYKSDECVICLSQRPDILFLKCGHVCSCTSCIKIKLTDDALGNIVKCPLCKAKIICKIPESTIGEF